MLCRLEFHYLPKMPAKTATWEKRRNAERALQSGLDAEHASHDTPEYQAAAEAMQPKG